MTCSWRLAVLLSLASSCDAAKVETTSHWQGIDLRSQCGCTMRTELQAAHVPRQATWVSGKPFCVLKPNDTSDDNNFYWMRAECFGFHDKVADCLPHNDSRSLYLIGDCHAYINTQPGLNSTLSGTSLPLYFFGANLPEWDSSEHLFQAVIDRLRVVLKPNDLVVWTEILTADDSQSPSSQAQLDFFKNRLMKTSAVCAEKQAQLVIMDDVPALSMPTSLCMLPGRSCTRSEADIRNQQKAKRDILAIVLQSSPSIKFWDYLYLFCHKGMCDQFIPGTNIEAFNDDDHLNKKGAHYLWPFMCDWLQEQNLLR